MQGPGHLNALLALLAGTLTVLSPAAYDPSSTSAALALAVLTLALASLAGPHRGAYGLAPTRAGLIAHVQTRPALRAGAVTDAATHPRRPRAPGIA